jgi:predicted Zn-dependent protease
MMAARCLLVALAVLALSLTGCVTNPATGKTELRLISSDEEVQMGRSIDSEVRKQYQVVAGGAAADRVQRIGARIAAVSDRRDFPYHFALLQSDEVNAFAAPGGYVYVTGGLESMAESDAELAAVMAHEVGHVAAGHSVQQLQTALGFQIFSDLLLGDKGGAAARAAADIAFSNVIMTGFSRSDEFEADEIGVKYAASAGYDPYGMASFFEKLEQRERAGNINRNFEFLMSHPNTPERRRRAEALAGRYARRN